MHKYNTTANFACPLSVFVLSRLLHHSQYSECGLHFYDKDKSQQGTDLPVVRACGVGQRAGSSLPSLSQP